MSINDYIQPNWDAPRNIRAYVSTKACYANASGDPRQQNLSLDLNLPQQPCWLQQVHGKAVHEFENRQIDLPADGAITRTPGTVLAIVTADCLPVLLCKKDGSVVAALHCGWRSLAADIIDVAVAQMQVPGEDLLAYLGPCISQAAYEVGPEVRAKFLQNSQHAEIGFTPGEGDRWYLDLQTIAQQKLNALGVFDIYKSELCTYKNTDLFYSYRRDGASGRMVSLLWIE